MAKSMSDVTQKPPHPAGVLIEACDESDRYVLAVGRQLRAVRIAFGMTQEQVARDIGMTAVSINRIERGHALPMAKTVGRLRKWAERMCGKEFSPEASQ